MPWEQAEALVHTKRGGSGVTAIYCNVSASCRCRGHLPFTSTMPAPTQVKEFAKIRLSCIAPTKVILGGLKRLRKRSNTTENPENRYASGELRTYALYVGIPCMGTNVFQHATF